MSSSLNKYLLVGASVLVLGAGIWYLSQDDEQIAVKFDPSKHTVEELRKVIDEIFIECATLYCQKLRMIREKKKDNEFKGQETLDELQLRQQNEMKESEVDAYKEFKVTEEFVVEWMQKYPTDEYIQKRFQKLKELNEMVFGSKTGDGKIEHMKCELIPNNLDEDTYIKIYRKQQALFRHEIYKVVQEMEKEKNPAAKESKLKEKYIEAIKKRDQFQIDAMKMYDVKLRENDNRSESLVMRECYLDFYSKSLVAQDAKPDTVTYSKRLQEEQKEHKEILDKIVMGLKAHTFKDQYDLNNGDPTIDPSLAIERQMSKKQKQLMGIKDEPEEKKPEPFSLSKDGLFVNVNEDKPAEAKKEEDKTTEKKDEEKTIEKKEEEKNAESAEAKPAVVDSKAEKDTTAATDKKGEQPIEHAEEKLDGAVADQAADFAKGFDVFDDDE